jgi:putative hydrolase of the HAD superfamily
MDALCRLSYGSKNWCRIMSFVVVYAAATKKNITHSIRAINPFPTCFTFPKKERFFMSDIQAVLFDLDETLLDRSRSLNRFLEDQYQRMRSFLAHVPYETYRALFVEKDKRGYVHKSIVYQELIDELSLRGLSMEQLLTDYRTHFNRHATPFPALRETLQALRARKLKLGIVTNGETEFQQNNIIALDLPSYVDTILISEQENLRKPDPRIFTLAATRLGVPTSACLFVGDHPYNDIQGARNVGMKTAWFHNGASWPADLPAPDKKIGSLLELL